jgi:exodeoxyribonuclease V
MKLSTDQEEALNKFKIFTESEKQNFILSGYAGTGKSTIVKEFIDYIKNEIIENNEIACICFTGKAALNMRLKSQYPAFTIHKFIYEYENLDTRLFENTKEEQLKLIEAQELRQIIECDYLFIDEYSLLTKKIIDDILTIARYKKIIWVGDNAQLEPFTKIQNDIVKLEEYLNKKDYITTLLSSIHRQNGDNPILDLANKVRNGDTELKEINLDGVNIWKKPFKELKFTIDTLDNMIVLCYKNITRYAANKCIRKKLKISSVFPIVNEKMIVIKNNKRHRIFNGQIVYIKEIDTTPSSFYGLKYMRCVLDDGIDEIESEIWVNPFERPNDNNKYNFDVKDYYNSEDEYIKEEIIKKFYELVHLDFGYCITIHKSQGSEWDNVILYFPDLLGYRGNLSRILYTAITRASKKLLILK